MFAVVSFISINIYSAILCTIILYEFIAMHFMNITLTDTRRLIIPHFFVKHVNLSCIYLICFFSFVLSVCLM